jgi:hypothetical protein
LAFQNDEKDEMDKDEIAAFARQHGPAALKALAEVAASPTAAPATRKRARLQLEARLAQLKGVAADSTLSPDLRRDAEDMLRKFGPHTHH